jgi:hypothetical protein
LRFFCSIDDYIIVEMTDKIEIINDKFFNDQFPYVIPSLNIFPTKLVFKY